MDLFKVSAMDFFYLKGRLNQFQHFIQHSKFAMLGEMLAPFKHPYFILAFIKEKKIMLDGVVWNLFQIKFLIQHFLASNAKNTIRLKRIKDVLFKLEMSVGNESNYSTSPECWTFPDSVQQFSESSIQPQSLPYDGRTLQYCKWFLKLNLHNGKCANTRKYRFLQGFS